MSVTSSFNSRAHGGRDRTKSISHSCSQVSIHAPTGGATAPRRDLDAEVRFNSRAHGGRDGGYRRWEECPFSFNSRAHGGRDADRRLDRFNTVVSIHAPTGGATDSDHAFSPRREFQFTRPRGARLPIFYHILSLTCKEDFREPVLFLDCLLLLSMIKYFAHAGSVLFFFREHPKGFLSTWGSRSVC